MTSVQPMQLEPLPPFKVGEIVSVMLEMVEKDGKHAFGTVNKKWIVEVASAAGRDKLAVGQIVRVVITETRPGHASGTQA